MQVKCEYYTKDLTYTRDTTIICVVGTQRGGYK